MGYGSKALKVLVQAHIINSVDSLDTSSCYGKMFCGQRHAEKTESFFGSFTKEAKLDNDNNCDISKYKLLLAVQYRLFEANVVNV